MTISIITVNVCRVQQSYVLAASALHDRRVATANAIQSNEARAPAAVCMCELALLGQVRFELVYDISTAHKGQRIVVDTNINAKLQI